MSAPVSHDPVARTAWLTARVRAEETQRPSPLFQDPFAARLVEAEGSPDDGRTAPSAGPIVHSFAEWRALAQRDPQAASAVARSASLAVRHRYFDDAVLSAVARGARTVVLLAAGLDTRVHRLALPAGLRWVEVDRAETLAYKRRVLADAKPHAELVDIGGDLRDPSVLARVADAVRGPSFWVLEGLLMYLPAPDVDALLDAVAAQLDAGSGLAFDVPNLVYLEPRGLMAPHIARNSAQGSPWLFATDDPAPLVASRGLTPDVVPIGHPRAHYGRLPWPPNDAPAPGQPASFLVVATRA